MDKYIAGAAVRTVASPIGQAVALATAFQAAVDYFVDTGQLDTSARDLITASFDAYMKLQAVG